MKRLSLLGLGLLACNAYAHISVIVTAAPPLREIVVAPQGYSQCYTVPQGFYDGIWHYQYRVCEYDARRLWVSGYWQCMNYARGGRCLRTVWVGSHWANPRDREYRHWYVGNRYPGHREEVVHIRPNVSGHREEIVPVGPRPQTPRYGHREEVVHVGPGPDNRGHREEIVHVRPESGNVHYGHRR